MISQKIVAFSLLAFGFFDTPTLKHRIEPKIIEESCRDHLMRIRWYLTEVSLKYAELDERENRVPFSTFRNRAIKVSHTHALDPGPETCTKDNFKMLDIQVAQWRFEYAVSATSVDVKGK